MAPPEKIHYQERITVIFEIPLEEHAGVTLESVDKLLYDIADDIQVSVLGEKFGARLARLGVMADVNRHNVL
jgi:hypothetical protein